MLMQETTIVKALQDVEKDFASKKASLERDLKKKTQQVLEKMMTDFARKLREATTHLKLIPKRYRDNIGQQTVVKKFLKLLKVTENSKVVARKTNKTRKQRTPKVLDETITEYLATERATKDVQKHYGWSAVTVSNRLKALLKSQKISVRKDGTSKFWRKA